MKPTYSICDIVHVTAPGKSDVVALIHAFFDASYGDGAVIVSGFALRKSKVLPFEREWRQMLADYNIAVFHMADCNARRGEFEGMDQARADECARRVIDILCRYAEYNMTALVHERDFDDVVRPQGIFDSPFAYCVLHCLLGVGKWSSGRGGNDAVSYFFESGDTAQGSADVMARIAGNDEFGKELIKYRSHSFVGKDTYLMQAADVFPWHNLKHYRRMRNGKTAPRGDFSAILSNIEHGFFIGTRDRLKEITDPIQWFLDNSSVKPSSVFRD